MSTKKVERMKNLKLRNNTYWYVEKMVKVETINRSLDTKDFKEAKKRLAALVANGHKFTDDEDDSRKTYTASTRPGRSMSHAPSSRQSVPPTARRATAKGYKPHHGRPGWGYPAPISVEASLLLCR